MGFSYGDLYGGGELFLNGTPSTPLTDSGHDLDFRTYVGLVPEPSTLLLVGTGALALARKLRRQREGLK